LLELTRGNLTAAEALAHEVLRLAEHRGYTELAQVIVVYGVLAGVELERNHLTEVTRLLDAGLAAHRNDPERTTFVALRTLEARKRLAVGEIGRARNAMADVHAGSNPEPPALLAARIAVVEAEIERAGGRPDRALERLSPWLDDALPEGAHTAEVRLCAAAAALTGGDFAAASHLASAVAETSRNPVHLTQAWLSLALVADHGRDDHRALQHLDRALAAAELENIRQPFLVLATPRLRSMLGHRLSLAPGPSYADLVLADLDDAAGGAAHNRPALVHDSLTDRQLMVLTHLARFQTNDEIATELYVSVNTVKAHVRAVYQKLEVTNRREAVSRGRELGII
jgi:LuxR family maltose regulon positive regulatory protein